MLTIFTRSVLLYIASLLAMRAMAKSGSATAAMTSISGSCVSNAVTTWRTTAESSTTSTWIRFIGFLLGSLEKRGRQWVRPWRRRVAV